MADRLRIDEAGVTFRSPVDGRLRLLTPEIAVEVQEALGSDVAMVLDECQPPDGDAGELRVRAATERTLRWSERARRAHRRPDQALFGIVQGGTSAALRRSHARQTAALGFDGYAHGGLGLGEVPELRSELIAAAAEALPEAAPRYLMGLGKPVDILDAAVAGVDLFDCVVPTRHARHGVLFTSHGLLRIKTARYRSDASPPDAACDCPTCTQHSRAYLRHLLRVNEMLGARLASLHNLHFYARLLDSIRRAIAEGTPALNGLRARLVEQGHDA
jgi:queuine tRNA-ribosyltransferase